MVNILFNNPLTTLLIRRIWVATKKDFPSFPTEVHSSHLRKLATALAHIYGDEALKGTVHDALNHSQSTSHSSYKSTIRRHQVAEAKLTITDLWKNKSGELKRKLSPGEEQDVIVETGKRAKKDDAPTVSMSTARLRVGKRVTKSPRFLSDYILP